MRTYFHGHNKCYHINCEIFLLQAFLFSTYFSVYFVFVSGCIISLLSLSVSLSLLCSRCQSLNQQNECDEYVRAAVVVYNIKSPKTWSSLKDLSSVSLSSSPPAPKHPAFLLNPPFTPLLSSPLTHTPAHTDSLVWDVLAPVDQGKNHIAEGG